jgi:hypothetical protein
MTFAARLQQSVHRIEPFDLAGREARPVAPVPRDVVVDHVEELLDVLSDANATNTGPFTRTAEQRVA